MPSPSYELVLNYMRAAKETGYVQIPFVIVSGDDGSMLQKMLQESVHILTQEYATQDARVVYDYTVRLGKHHAIKISADDMLELSDGEKVQDWGMREMNTWFTLSPLGQRKVLCIENIERLTDGAANALLKLFEEPLPERMIVATTSHKDSLLPTIISRAMVFSCMSGGVYNMAHALEQLSSTDKQTGADTLVPLMKDSIADMCMVHKQSMLGDRRDGAQDTCPNMSELFTRLAPITKAGYFPQLMLGLSQEAANQQQRDLVQKAQSIYVRTEHAISHDNLLFDFLLTIYAPTNS